MKPLLGGTLYWTVNPEFNTGAEEEAPQKRTVDFVMLTTFEMDSGCTYSFGNRVTCAGKKNGAADVHGVLCVKAIKQLSPSSNPEYATRHIAGENGAIGECPYVWKTPRDPTQIGDCQTKPPQVNWLAGIQCYGNVEPQYNNLHIPDTGPDSKVGPCTFPPEASRHDAPPCFRFHPD
jgi:hypothetical protein